MALQISERALAIKPSATLTVAARALALKAAGKDIVSLAAGEPNFDTPEIGAPRIQRVCSVSSPSAAYPARGGGRDAAMAAGWLLSRCRGPHRSHGPEGCWSA